MSEHEHEPEARTEAGIDAVLGGRGDPASDSVLLWLAGAARPTPPARLAARVDRAVTRHADRPHRLVAVAALALATAFVVQAGGSLMAGDWIARHVDEPFAPHALLEGALATIAAAVCAAAAAVRRAWGGVAVLTCTPLALGLGLHGVGEFSEFAAGAALHTVEGALGLLLLGAWWWSRRESRGPARRAR